MAPHTPLPAPALAVDTVPLVQLARSWPPLVAWLAPNLIFWWGARRHGHDWWDALSRYRWDSLHYIGIARLGGYELQPCVGHPAVTADPETWCGDIGWFPLYSLLVRWVHQVSGLSWQGAGTAVSEVFVLVAVVALWLLLGARVSARTLPVLALAVLWPGAVYLHAVFPLSMAVGFTLMALWGLQRRAWWMAGVAGAAAAACYPVAAAVAAAAAVYVLLVPGDRSVKLRRLAVAAGLPVLGTLYALGMIWAGTGKPDGYFVGQGHFSGGRIYEPTSSFMEIIAGRRVFLAPGTGLYLWSNHKIVATVAVEMFAALLLLVGAVVVVLWAAGRGRATALDVALLAYGVLLFVVPLVVGPQITQVRSHVLMLPLALVARHLPAAVVWLVAGLAAAVTYAVGVLFVLAALV